ncbi:MAG: AbgT family transporter [Deltaproteobacteria bacterium]|nr:AbgT family transporter [Deltaproteobacteria bacterium]
MSDTPKRSFGSRMLDLVERVGNRLPDPALLFVYALFLVWLISALLDGHAFEVPSKDGPVAKAVESQLSASAITTFLADMVKTFTSFHPLGVVLVALLGVGVADDSGFIGAALKRMVALTPRMLLTPMLILVALLSHTAADAGYVLVIPLGGVIFYAAGRHPLAGIAAAFAGVSGGFSANPVPSSLDPLLQGLTQSGAAILDPSRTVNPLANWYFTAASCALIILVGWFLTDRVIEPRLRRTAPVDGDPADMPKIEGVSTAEGKGLLWGGIAFLLGIVILVVLTVPESSVLRSPTTGSPTASDAPLMQAIVPLIFLLFLIPGVVYGFAAGTYKSHRDVVKSMAKSMSTMGYYLVMAFFASLFIYAFNKSQLGALLAVEGADALRSANLPPQVTIVAIIILCAFINLLIGSASAKWALLAPIFVPMLMQLGISPELTQAAYRVGDSTTNIITPLMPYFPLVVAFSQRYVKKTGIGTLTAMMLPYSMSFLLLWTLFLLGFWALGIPLGIAGGYSYPP